MFGAIDVLLPLRVNVLGGGHALIAVGFIGGAAIESVLAPLAGRLSDRVGRRAPYVLGMAICAVSMVIFAFADSLPMVIASLLVTSLGSGLCFAPAMTLISDSAEESGLHQGYAVGVTNMAWAAAQVVGGVAGAAVAGVTGDAAPSIAIAVILVLTILYAFRALDRPSRPPPRRVRSRSGKSALRRRRRYAAWDARRRRGNGSTGPGTSAAGRRGRWRRARGRSSPRRSAPRRRAGEKVSVAGSGHSFTEAAMTDATMVRLDALRGVLDADRGSGLVRVGGGTVLARAERGTGGARAGAGEPRRHRRADDRRGDLDRHPRDRRELRQHLGAGRGAGAGARRRQRPRADRGGRAGAAAGGADRDRRARGDQRGDAPLLPRLHPARGSTRRTGSPTSSTASTSSPSANDHFELFTFPYSDRALVLERNRTDEAPRPKSRAVAFLNDVLLENWALEAMAATGKAIPRTIPALARFAGLVATGTDNQDRSHRIFVNRRNVRFTEMEYAVPREHGPTAVRRVVEWVRANRYPVFFPIEVRVAARRRRRPQRRPRTPHRLHRRPPVPGDGVAALLRGGRGDHGRLRRPPPLGQAPLPDRRDPGPALPPLGGVPASPRRARPRPRLHQRVRRPRPRPVAGVRMAPKTATI